MMLYCILTALLLAALGILFWPALHAQNLPKKQRFRFVIIASALFSLGVFGLYATLGAPQLVPLIALREQKLASLKAVISAASTDIKANPSNLAAWVRLGEAFGESGQYAGAANAFKQAVILSQGNPAFILAYAKALIFENNDTVTDDARKSLEMVLLQDPQNAEARYYLAIRQLQDGHAQEAMQQMRALYHSLPDNSPLKAAIDAQIGRAR